MASDPLRLPIIRARDTTSVKGVIRSGDLYHVPNIASISETFPFDSRADTLVIVSEFVIHPVIVEC